MHNIYVSTFLQQSPVQLVERSPRMDIFRLPKRIVHCSMMLLKWVDETLWNLKPLYPYVPDTIHKKLFIKHEYRARETGNIELGYS